MFEDKKSKLVECEYCENKRCIKCLKISDSMYKSLGGRADFPWFCNGCLGKAMKCIKEERDIETRCKDFLENFKLEVDSKLGKMQSDIDEIKHELRDKNQSQTGSKQEEVVKEVCSNLSDRLARQKNIVIFNLPEEGETSDQSMGNDLKMTENFTNVVADMKKPELNVRRLGRKGDNPRPMLVSFKNDDDKSKVMRNLYKLKNAKSPLNKISVKHDMTKQEREQDKKPEGEARSHNDRNSDPTYKFVVTGLPWDRKIIKVRKRIQPMLNKEK